MQRKVDFMGFYIDLAVQEHKSPIKIMHYSIVNLCHTSIYSDKYELNEYDLHNNTLYKEQNKKN